MGQTVTHIIAGRGKRKRRKRKPSKRDIEESAHIGYATNRVNEAKRADQQRKAAAVYSMPGPKPR